MLKFSVNVVYMVTGFTKIVWVRIGTVGGPLVNAVLNLPGPTKCREFLD